MSLLNEFYHGNMIPSEFVLSDEYMERSHKLVEYENRIKERLEGQEDAWQLLWDYSLATAGLVSLSAEENFVFGFELGAELMLEILKK